MFSNCRMMRLGHYVDISRYFFPSFISSLRFLGYILADTGMLSVIISCNFSGRPNAVSRLLVIASRRCEIDTYFRLNNIAEFLDARAQSLVASDASFSSCLPR